MRDHLDGEEDQGGNDRQIVVVSKDSKEAQSSREEWIWVEEGINSTTGHTAFIGFRFVHVDDVKAWQFGKLTRDPYRSPPTVFAVRESIEYVAIFIHLRMVLADTWKLLTIEGSRDATPDDLVKLAMFKRGRL